MLTHTNGPSPRVQVPAMLLPTGQLLSQSAVILRYAGYQARAVPPNEPDRLNCEMIAELAKVRVVGDVAAAVWVCL